MQAVHMEGNIWECDHLTTPFVLGIVRPRIYIPFHLSAEEKPYILAHETYHIKKGRSNRAAACICAIDVLLDQSICLACLFFDDQGYGNEL